MTRSVGAVVALLALCLAPSALGYGTGTTYVSSAAGTPPGAWASVPSAADADDGGAAATLTETDAGGVPASLHPANRTFATSSAGWTSSGTSAALCAVSSAHDPGDGAPAGSLRTSYSTLLNLLGLLATCSGSWTSDPFTWTGGTPAAVAFSMDRMVDAEGLLGAVEVSWQAHLVDDTVPGSTPLVSGTATADSGWTTQVAPSLGPGDLVPGHVYRIRIEVGFRSALSLVSGIGFGVDDVVLSVTPQARQADGEMVVGGVPRGSTHTLEIRARTTGEPFDLLVWDGASWATRATVPGTSYALLSHGLTPAEWNGGDVRVRMRAAGTGADAVADVLSVDWLRVVSTGGITVSGPTSVVLPSVVIDGAAPTASTGSMGFVEVADAGGSASGWTLTATATRWALDGAPGEMLPADALSATAPPPSSPDGSDLTGIAAGAGGTLAPAAPITLMTAAPGHGIGTFRTDPVLSLAVPVTALHGVYRSAITLSAS